MKHLKPSLKAFAASALVVLATVGAGTSQASATVTVPTRPRTPTATVASNTATVSFRRPRSNGGAPILRYNVRCASSNQGVTRRASGLRSPIRVTSLSWSKTYTCAVRAVNSEGGSRWARTAQFRTPARPRPTA